MEVAVVVSTISCRLTPGSIETCVDLAAIGVFLGVVDEGDPCHLTDLDHLMPGQRVIGRQDAEQVSGLAVQQRAKPARHPALDHAKIEVVVQKLARQHRFLD